MSGILKRQNTSGIGPRNVVARPGQTCCLSCSALHLSWCGAGQHKHLIPTTVGHELRHRCCLGSNVLGCNQQSCTHADWCWPGACAWPGEGRLDQLKALVLQLVLLGLLGGCFSNYYISNDSQHLYLIGVITLISGIKTEWGSPPSYMGTCCIPGIISKQHSASSQQGGR